MKPSFTNPSWNDTNHTEKGVDRRDKRSSLRKPSYQTRHALHDGGLGGLRGAIGTPEQIREYLRRYEEAGVDQVIFVSQAGRNRHEHIMESLDLFGREILPEFKERDARAERDKARWLAPIVETVMARKPASDHPPLPATDYSFPAIPRAEADRAGADDFHRFLDKVAGDAALGDTSVIDQWRNNG